MKKTNLLITSLALLLASCNGGGGNNDSSSGKPDTDKAYFNYEDISFVDKIGEKTNSESHKYDKIKVNPVEGELREDFAFGVDASMTYAVEKAGGVYYNEAGQEQDVFQILRKAGVNFARFRIWVKPETKLRKTYGGGGNNLQVDLELAKRAKAANMNVMIDFHYSDFWADPDKQNRPSEWRSLTDNEIPAKIEEYTKETLETFKDQGITVDAVQIGNETNNGMCGYAIDWNNTDKSFDMMANMFKSGIKGAKDAFPNVKTLIHLANGGNAEEFKSYFTAMDARGVDFDIVGASYYPHLSGSLSELQNNLDTITELTGKPAMVVETSWGFTDDFIDGVTANSYSSADEDVGGYLTSEQAQATELRDITNILSKVKNNRGLGIFYWEPGWLPLTGVGWATKEGQSWESYGDNAHTNLFEDGLATWSNQGLFSYTGKALSSLNTFKYLREGKNFATEKSISARKSVMNITINTAEKETLPETAKVVTDFDAIRDAKVTWEEGASELIKEPGDYNGIKGTIEGGYEITLNVHAIQNFIRDPGFENQGTTDNVKDPWKIDYVTPEGDKVVKLDRKKDIRSGKTDLNWYHSSKEFSFSFSQTVELEAGSYSLKTYLMAEKMSKAAHTSLYLFYQIGTSDVVELDFCSDEYIRGWGDGYQTLAAPTIEINAPTTLKVGLKGSCEAGAWAHNDDWELVMVK